MKEKRMPDTNTAHARKPWFVERVTNHPGKIIIAERQLPHDALMIIVLMDDTPDNETRAQQIAHEHNAFGDLLASAKRIEQFLLQNLRHYSADEATAESLLGAFRAAIAMAEGK